MKPAPIRRKSKPVIHHLVLRGSVENRANCHLAGRVMVYGRDRGGHPSVWSFLYEMDSGQTAAVREILYDQKTIERLEPDTRFELLWNLEVGRERS